MCSGWSCCMTKRKHSLLRFWHTYWYSLNFILWKHGQKLPKCANVHGRIKTKSGRMLFFKKGRFVFGIQNRPRVSIPPSSPATYPGPYSNKTTSNNQWNHFSKFLDLPLFPISSCPLFSFHAPFSLSFFLFPFLAFPLKVGSFKSREGVLRTVVSSRAGSGAEPKSNLVHFSLKLWHLVATMWLIFLRINWPNFVHFTK